MHRCLAAGCPSRSSRVRSTSGRAPTILPIRRADPNPAPAGTVPVWVSEAAHDLRGIDVGAVFDLPLGGHTVKASVRGVWRDYERPGGAVVIPRAIFVRYTGDTRATTAALWLDGGREHGRRYRRAYASALQRSGEYEIAVPREIRRRSLRVFDRTFAVTYLLEAIAVLIGLVRHQRQHQFAGAGAARRSSGCCVTSA